MISKELLIQCREALDHFDDIEKTEAAIKALQAVIDASEPEPEPMFWVRMRSDGGYEGPIHNDGIERVRKLSGAWSPLYLHPPVVREPLTDEQIDELLTTEVVHSWTAFARAIEAAHDIK